MDLKDIQELIKFVAKSGATEVELEIDNVKISIKSPPKKRRGAPDENPIIVHNDTEQSQQEIVPTTVTQNIPIVVNTNDALLICKKKDEQKIKQFVTDLNSTKKYKKYI